MNKRLLVRTTTGATTGLPLSGIRVLELGQAIAGPFAGQLLGCALYLNAIQTRTRPLSIDTLVLRSLKSRHQQPEIHFEYGEDWTLTGPVLGGGAWPAIRRASRLI